MVASLLSIQSLKLYPNGGDAASFLINDNQSARLIHRIESDYLDHSEIFALSPDGKYMALAGCEEEYEGESVCKIGNLRILEIATGTEVASVSPEGGVRSLAFSPDGKFVATAGCEVFDSEALHCSRSYARLWEVTTGKEAAYITPFAILGNILFSPDGRWLASDDGLLWDVVHLSSEPIFLEEDDSSIYSLAFSPDGNYVAVGYSENLDNTARVLETSTGKEVARVEHDGLVGLVAFSPDGKYVASAEYLHGIVIVWEAATGNEVARMTHEDNILSSVTFSPDGKYLAIGVGGTARVWETATSLEVARTNFGVGSVAFSPDGKYVVSAVDTSARVWEAATGVEVVRMTHPANVTFAAFSPVALPGSGAGVIVSGSSDGTVLIWGIVLGRDAISLAHDGPVLSAAFSQDGKYIASAGCDQTDNEIDICNQGSVQIWEAPTGIEVERILHDNYLNSVTFTFDGKFVSASSENTTVFVWESASGKEVARITPDGGLDSFVISPDGKYVVTHMNAYSGIPPVVWDVPTGKEVTRLGEKGVFSIAFSPDGKYVSTGNDVWEAATGEVVGHIDDESFFQFSTAFSPDGKYVALGSWVGVGESTGGENIARVWEVATGIEVARMTYDFGVETVAFSPDGKYVVSGGGETARVWVAATGAEVSRMTHDGSVSSVAFSPDGKYVLSRGSDGTALLGEADTGMEVARITSASGVISAAFSPDGKYMLFVSVYGDAHVMLWQADDLIINACESMSRNLTRAEWAQYIGDVLPYQAVCEKLPIEPEITSTPTVAP
jgi:WD40 repeat protein